MKKIFLIIPFLLFLTACPEMDYTTDTDSPQVQSVIYAGTNQFSLNRDSNSDPDNIPAVNQDVPIDKDIVVRFTEEMYIGSIVQFGESETVVILEGVPSRSFLNDIASSPLTDTNREDIHEMKLEVSSQNRSEVRLLTSQYPLKPDTIYTLIVSKEVKDSNGRELTVTYMEDGKELTVNDNFFILFETASQ